MPWMVFEDWTNHDASMDEHLAGGLLTIIHGPPAIVVAYIQHEGGDPVIVDPAGFLRALNACASTMCPVVLARCRQALAYATH